MKRDARDDNAWPEQERRLDEERRLIVQQVLPPAPGDEFRQDHRDVVVRVGQLELFNVIHQRLHQRAIGRGEDVQAGPPPPPLPPPPPPTHPRPPHLPPHPPP